MKIFLLLPFLLSLGLPALAEDAAKARRIDLGPRPAFLVQAMDESPLKKNLLSCLEKPSEKTTFSIGHRGAPLQFPEHTRESYEAAARMGAGVLECDVTFTKDKELVCRHAQCDLHTTTNILAIPELAAKCTEKFKPYDPATDTPAAAKCCASDLTLAEFKTLCGKMDAANPKAQTPEEYLDGTANWRTDLYSTCGTVLSHRESIQLFQELDVDMTPELKKPDVAMPFKDFSQEAYAQKMIDEYKAAGVSPQRVYAQSFQLDDVLYWIENEPKFGQQAVFLDERNRLSGFDPANPATWQPDMKEVADLGVQIIGPPLWMLLRTDDQGKIHPSVYAQEAKAAGLDILTWTLERSGRLVDGGGWYFQTVPDAIKNDGDVFVVLDVLAKDVGVRGVFTDWPATVTFYDNCR